MYKVKRKNKSITEKILSFQKNGTGYNEIFKELSIAVYKYPVKRNSRNEDDQGDFYLFFFPKIMKMIMRFNNNGIPFEHYLNSTLSSSYKSFRNLKNRNEVINKFTVTEDFYTDFLNSENFLYHTEQNYPDHIFEKSPCMKMPEQMRILLKINKGNKMKKKSMKYRMLFLALRYAYFLDSYKIDFIIYMTGFNKDWILLNINNIMKLIDKKVKQINKYREKRNYTFFCQRLLERRILYENNRNLKKNLIEELLRNKLILYSLNKRIANYRLIPSYSQIAGILNIPKGTVGTGLRWLKEISKKALNNY